MMERPNINVTVLPPRKVLKKSPTLKRKSKAIPISDKVQLEKVLGLTVTSNAALSVHHSAGIVAYPAGCVVVLYNQRKNKQSHIHNQSRKTITCLAISPDAKYLVTGECGHQPAVRVWELEEKTQVAEFSAHKFAINCVIFSPNMKYIVSVGNQHDMAVNVWNWKTKTKLASGKVATKVSGLAFNEDSNSFITVGNRHVKFWYLDTSKTKVRETIPLSGRSGILGEQKNNHFCGVVVGRGTNVGITYVLTKSGLLCEFNEKRLLDKWVELRAARAHCMAADDDYIYVGCSDGIIRVFSATSLHFVSTMPKPHYLGVDVAAGHDSSHMMSHPANAQYPDCIAIGIDTECHKITAIYNDHSVYIWDVRDIRKVGKSRSFLYHSSCIWGLEVYPILDDSYKSSLPADSFITCSSDDTIRVWNIDSHMSADVIKRNIYSNELLKVLYTDKDLTNILDIEFNPAGKTDKTDTQCLEKNGVRCLRVSPDGQLLASGDRQGNIRIHELQFMEEIKMLEAHDSEVLCLEYTRPQTGVRLLTSASRDRLIHVFDMDQNYGLVQTMDDHSSAITSVRYAEQDQQLHMLSCGADKSLLFRTAQIEPEFQFVLNRHLVGKTTLYDMDIDPTNKFVATACQDRNVRIYNIKNGKQKKSYKGSIGDDGTMIKIQLDPSGQYVATSCSDKNLCILDFFTGEVQASMFGHSEVVTGLKFMNDFKHLISVSGDGCIFVWRLSPDLTHNIHQRLITLGKMSKEQLINEENRAAIIPSTPKVILPDPADEQNHNYGEDTDFPIIENQAVRRKLIDEETIKNNNATVTTPTVKKDKEKDGYEFSVGQLPAWAKKQVLNETPKSDDATSNPTGPRGRWAQRIDNQAVVIKSILDGNNLKLSLSDSLDHRRFTVEEQTLANQISELRRETIVIPSAEKKSPNIPIICDDEANQDDDDDDDEFGNKSLAEKHSILENDDDTDSPVRLSGGKVTMTRGNDAFSSVRQLRQSLSVESDNDADDEEQKEDILYLPNEEGAESPEAMASSFHVFEGDANSYKDESTDHGSNESDTESETSAPNTPHIPLSEADAEAEFMKNNFDNLGNSPLLTESFDSTMESIEKRFAFNEDPTQLSLFNSRHSISSRYLSRAQQQHLRNIALQNSMQKPHSNISDQSHAALRNAGGGGHVLSTAGGTNQEHQQSDVIPEKGPPASPPVRRRRMPETPSVPPSTRLSTPAASQEHPFSDTVSVPSRGRMSLGPDIESQPRSRASLGGDRSRSRKTAEDKLSARPEARGGRASIDFAPPNRSKSEYNLTSGSDESAPSSPSKRSAATRPTLTRTNSYQRGTQSSKAKTHESTNTLPSNKRNLKSRSKISPALKNKFKSTPDLAAFDDEEDDFLNLQNLASKTTEDLPSKDEAKTKKYSRRSMPATKLDRQDPFGLNQPVEVGASTKSSLTAKGRTSSVSSDNSDPDRLAMPPPPTTKVPALKQDTFHKKATSKPSSQSNLTLAEAKAILLGKSSTNAISGGSGSGSRADSGPGSSNSSTSGKADTAGESTTNNSASRVKVASPSPSPVPSPNTYGKWAQSNKEELDEMPVKERSRRIPFRQPISQGEGDDPREGSPEPETHRRPAFQTSASSNISKLKTEKESVEKEKSKGDTPDSEGEADSPGSSYAGSDSEPSFVIAAKTVKPHSHSRVLPSVQKERGSLGEIDVSSVNSSPGHPSSPTKTFSLPRENRSNSATEVTPASSKDGRLSSYGSLDRKGRLPSHAERKNSGNIHSPKSDSGRNDSVDILGNFVKKSNSSSDINRDSFSPPRRDSVEKNSVVSDEEKPQQTVKSRISSWECASQSPSQSPATVRHRSTSPAKGIGKPKTPEGTPPPRPNNTPLPPPPSIASPRSSPDVSPRSSNDKDNVPPVSSTRLVPKQKDSSGLIITPTRTRLDYSTESESATTNEPVKTFNLTKPKELPRIPENALNGASPAASSHAMNATFTMSPRGTPVSSKDSTNAPLAGIASLRAASKTAAELKQKQQEEVRASNSLDLDQTVVPDDSVSGEADAYEIKRPDKSRRYPPTSLTASPPQQIKTVQLSEPKSPESLSSNSVLSSTENEVGNSANRSALRLPLSQQTTAATPESQDSSDEKQCEELIRKLRSTVDQAVAFSQRVDGSLQTRVRQALKEVHEALGNSLPSGSIAPRGEAAAQTPETPDDETMELLKMIKSSSDKLLNKFGPV